MEEILLVLTNLFVGLAMSAVFAMATSSRGAQ